LGVALARAEAHRLAGRVSTAAQAAHHALSLAEEADLPASAADALRVLAHLAVYESELDVALAHATRALTAAPSAGPLRGDLLRILGTIEATTSRFEDARGHLRQALTLARRAADARAEAEALAALAELEQAAGHLDTALRLRERALAMHRRTGDRSAEGLAALNVAYTYLELGEWAKAGALARDAVALFGALGQRRIEVIALVCTSSTHVAQQEFEAALESARRAVMLASDVGQYAAVLSHMSLGVAEALLDHLEEARAALDQAASAVEQSPNALFTALLEVAEAAMDASAWRTASARGDHAEAARHLERAWARLGPTPAEDAAPAPADVRIVRRIMKTVLAHAQTADGRAAGPRALVVEPTGRWFAIDDGGHVACAHRPVLRRLLVALVHAHLAQPGRPIPVDELLAAGWPGERMMATAAVHRLQVTISRLRLAGLGSAIRADPDGYFLDAALSVRLFEPA
jgi:tetratricopeptide (TPR) repeat protein